MPVQFKMWWYEKEGNGAVNVKSLNGTERWT